MNLPTRKPHRLTNYDYSLPGAYFITICTKDRKNLFWENTSTHITSPADVVLSPWGQIAASAIMGIPVHYPAISVDSFTVMPNHIHLLLQIHTDANGQLIPTPPISIAIQQLKGFISKQIGIPIWQKHYHDHVVRNEQDYLTIWEYVTHNPCKWADDCFYTP